MLAPPGAGKGTQGKRIAAELGSEHISSGSLLRAAVAADTPLGRAVAEHLAAGTLAPDTLVTQAVAPVLSERDGYVLDGFPRTVAQAEAVDFDMVIYLDVPDEVLIERMLARGRADDCEDVIAARLQEYARDTEPLIDHYREAGVLVAVDGHRAVDEVTEDLLRLLR